MGKISRNIVMFNPKPDHEPDLVFRLNKFYIETNFTNYVEMLQWSCTVPRGKQF